MSAGFIYILENEAIPGLLKIGSTEKHPEERARELAGTGVPKPFKVVYHRHVSDCQLIEKLVHQALESQGFRENSNREFFDVSTNQAVALIETIIVGCESKDAPNSNEGFFAGHTIYQAIKLPGYDEQIDEERAESLRKQLTEVARIGYFPALRDLAEIYARNYRNSNKFRQYYQEFFIAARHDYYGNLGQYLVEYIEHLEEMKCLFDADFAFVQQYLVDGDKHTYENFVVNVNRFLHGATKRRCLDL